MKSHSEWSVRIIWSVMVFFALQASFDGLSYVFGDTDLFASLFRDKYIRHLSLVQTHSVAGSLALLTSLSALLPESRRFRWHRSAGRLYLLSVLVAGITALPMSVMAAGGILSKIGFGLQALLWIGTAALAAHFARRKRFQFHRRWMVRSFALTYGAVLSRLLLNGLLQAGIPFHSVYDAISWSWLITLGLGELWLYLSQPKLTKS